MVVLVTGSNGQLGQAIKYIAGNYTMLDFHFTDKEAGDITDLSKLLRLFDNVKPQFCINAAAYTAVDKAESEPEKADLINHIGVENVARACLHSNCTLLHISTDFVFDGSKNAPYSENDVPNPQSVYGKTKLEGERAIASILKNFIIIRTSWVYSQFGHNFMKTMLRLASDRDQISVVNDQIGTPTNAVDLAEVLLKIILKISSNLKSNYSGVYHFSSEGECSWYEFARKIFEVNKIEINLQPVATSEYPTAAKRPQYSVLDKSKIRNVFGIEVQPWQKSLISING